MKLLETSLIRSNYDTNHMGILPHMRRKDTDKNQAGHGGEKPYCILPEVQEGKRG